MTPKSEYFVETLVEDLGRWFPKHRCLVGVSIPISRVPDNVIFVGTHFDVPMLDRVGVSNAHEVFYLPIQDVLVAMSFKTGSRTAHMVVGIPTAIDFTERDCCLVLIVFGSSVIPRRKHYYPIEHDYELASAYVDGGWYSAR